MSKPQAVTAAFRMAPLSLLYAWVIKAQSLGRRIVARLAKLRFPVRNQSNPVVVPVASQSPLTVQQYRELQWTIEGVSHRCILVDLTRVPRILVTFFDSLACSKNIQRQTRLGVRVAFERWAELHSKIAPFAQQLKEREVELVLFYEEQDYTAWYTEGRLIHNVEAVIHKLSHCAALAVQWPMLLDVATSLLEGCGKSRCAEALIALAQIAFDCGAMKKALALAHESLLYSNILPPIWECKARRILGLALIELGQPANGVDSIEQAIALGQAGGAWEDAASAAYELGVHAASCDDLVSAENRYREALCLLPRDPSELLGKIHGALGGVLLRRDKDDEALVHMLVAHEMRVVPTRYSAPGERERYRSLHTYLPEARAKITRSLLS